MRSLMKQRKENYEYLKKELTTVLALYGERCLETKNNKISVACTLTALNEKVFVPQGISATFFGSYLFSRRVSGVRVVASSQGKQTNINGSLFANYGSHSDAYPHLPYFTAAASVGQTKEDVALFIARLREAFEHFLKQDPSKLLLQQQMLMLAIEKQQEEEKKKE